MADVGRLRWILTADTRQFETGMNRVRTSLTRIGRLAAGYMGARGVGDALKMGLNTADAIGKISRAAGVTTDDVQQLRFAFAEAGGEAREFDRLILRFNQTLGELATRHSGPLATFLRETDAGLFVVLKQAENTTEAFLALADAASKLGTRQRAALLGAAFGRPSQAMNVLTQQGRAGIRAGMGRLPQGELITREMIAEAERTNDEILRIQERAMLKVSRAALDVIGFVQDLKREFSAGTGEQNSVQQWIGENMPWTMKVLRFRGVLGRMWE